MIKDLNEHRRNKATVEAGAHFTQRHIKGVEPGKIYNTVSNIIDPYGLPSVTLIITKTGGFVDITIKESNSIMHTKSLYGPERFEELIDLIGDGGIVIDMKFNGCFFKLDGPIEGLNGSFDIKVGE